MSVSDIFNPDAVKAQVAAPKIVQIAADKHRLYALTDAGEIWLLNFRGWQRLQPLPTAADAGGES